MYLVTSPKEAWQTKELLRVCTLLDTQLTPRQFSMWAVQSQRASFLGFQHFRQNRVSFPGAVLRVTQLARHEAQGCKWQNSLAYTV